MGGEREGWGGGHTKEHGQHAKQKEARALVRVDLVAGCHDEHGGAGRLLVEQDGLLDVVVAAVRPLRGQVERADGQHGPHDVVAGQPQLDEVIAPELPDARVGGEGGVGLCGEVVEQFQLQHRELCAFWGRHGRCEAGRRGARRGDWRVGLDFGSTGGRPGHRAALEKGALYAVGYAVEAFWVPLVALTSVSCGHRTVERGGAGHLDLPGLACCTAGPALSVRPPTNAGVPRGLLYGWRRQAGPGGGGGRGRGGGGLLDGRCRDGLFGWARLFGWRLQAGHHGDELPHQNLCLDDWLTASGSDVEALATGRTVERAVGGGGLVPGSDSWRPATALAVDTVVRCLVA